MIQQDKAQELAETGDCEWRLCLVGVGSHWPCCHDRMRVCLAEKVSALEFHLSHTSMHNRAIIYLCFRENWYCFLLKVFSAEEHQRAAPNGRQPFARMGKQDPRLAGIDYIFLSETSPDDLFNDLQGF